MTLGTTAFFWRVVTGLARLAIFLAAGFLAAVFLVALAFVTDLRVLTDFFDAVFFAVLVAAFAVFLTFALVVALALVVAFSTRARAGFARVARVFEDEDLDGLPDPGRDFDRLSPFVTWLLILFWVPVNSRWLTARR